MNHSINLKREVKMDFSSAIEKLTQALSTEGFGVLTRIDFHTKMKEKLGKDLRPTVILGACNPKLAMGAYEKNKEVTSLLPCNAVLSEITPGTVLIELLKPTAMMEILKSAELVALAQEADQALMRVLEKI